MLIRDLVPGDLTSMQEIWGDPAVMRYTAGPAKTKREATRTFNEWLSNDRYVRHQYRLGIARRDDNTFLGTISLDLERFSSGYTHSMYMHRQTWGQGLATDAYYLLLEFAFDDLNLHRLWTACHVENQGAARLIERVGFTRTGTIGEYAPRADSWVDCRTYTYLNHEWRRHHPPSTRSDRLIHRQPVGKLPEVDTAAPVRTMRRQPAF